MCGIAGVQGTFPSGVIGDMTRCLAHRGPDGDGVAILGDGTTALGHRRLSIIDLSPAGRQPMKSASDRGGGHQEGLTLVFNGEIYNFPELRAELEQQGHCFRSCTDSEVLLHLYERDGTSMVDRLNGIFAFAIHDDRPGGRPHGMERGAIFLARDHLGVKPLYHATNEDGFAFASEIKALLRIPSVSRVLDPLAIHYMLAYLWTPAPYTALAAVRKLEPGCAMIVHAGRIRRHWSYYRSPYDGHPTDRSEAELADELRSLLEQAVSRQLIADVPVGAFLSGGLDSSSVVAMMKRAWPDRRIPCFTIQFAPGTAIDGATDDLPYARRVAAHLDVDLHEITIQPDVIHDLERVVWWMDEPQADPAPINALLIARRARELAVPVLLSGAGGDDIFGGYRRHWALRFERTWQWLPVRSRAALARAAQALAVGSWSGQSMPALRRAAKMFAYADQPADRRITSYFQWTPDLLRRSLYAPFFAQQVQSVDTAAPLLASLSNIPAEPDRLQRMLYLEGRHFLADHNLNYTDRAGMAAGVEIRVPLLDLDLVSFAAALPPQFKQRGRTGKPLFKRAMEGILPRDVIYRPKTGFGAPLRRWLRHELRSVVDDTLSRPSLEHRSLFDPAAVRRLIDLDRAGRVDGAYLIFALMNLEIWCRQFVDGNSPV